jgi:hypothetical protein
MGRRTAFKFDTSKSFPHLPSAPIVEAVIHWTARAGKEFQPDELKNQLGQRLPNYPECQPTGLLHVEAEFSAVGASESRRASWHGYRLTSSDKMYIVQFNRDGLVFTPQTGGPSLIFDIDVVTTQGFPCEDEILKNHLARMRWLKNNAFFHLMTQRAIKRFRKAKQ